MVDSGRLAVFAHSRGGLAGLMLAASDTRVRAVASIATPVDLATYVRDVSTFAPSAAVGIVQFIGGLPEEVPGVYEMLNAQNLPQEAGTAGISGSRRGADAPLKP